MSWQEPFSINFPTVRKIEAAFLIKTVKGETVVSKTQGSLSSLIDWLSIAEERIREIGTVGQSRVKLGICCYEFRAIKSRKPGRIVIDVICVIGNCGKRVSHSHSSGADPKVVIGGLKVWGNEGPRKN